MEPGNSLIYSLESSPFTATSDSPLTNPKDLIARQCSDSDPTSPACLSNQRSSQSSKSTSNPHQVLATVSVNRHVWGFYCYSIASEIYSIVSTTLFLPILLEQFARDNARVYPDYIQPCPGSRSEIQDQTSKSGLDSSLTEGICKTKILGGWLNTSSFPLYVSSLTIAVMAFLIISISSAADDEKMRKFLLLIFAACGSLTGTFFIFVESKSPVWPIVGVLSLVSNVSLGASTVCLNSLLAGIAKEKAAKINQKIGKKERVDGPEYTTLVSQCTSQISARGVAFGFAAGIFALGMSLILVIHRQGDLDTLRWAIGASAVCWGLLTIPAGLWIPPMKSSILDGLSNPFQPIKSSREMFKMLKGFRNIFHTIKFLMAWAFLSNGYSTMTSSAILYAKVYLKMKSSNLIVLGTLTPSMGIMGALIFSAVQKHIPYFNSGADSSLKILKLVVIPTCAIPLYVSTSVLFGSKALSLERDMYLVAGFFGMLYGGFQSYSRAVYTQLLPPGQEARWNSFFSLTAKASSFSGPLVVGIITDITHDMRYGFVLILVLLTTGSLLLQTISMEKGKKDAENYRFLDDSSDKKTKRSLLSEKMEIPIEGTSN